MNRLPSRIPFVLASLCALGAPAAAAGDHSVTASGPWTPENRKSHRPDDLWRYYMHGVVDHFATVVDWRELCDPEAGDPWFADPEATLHTPYRRSDLPAVRLAGERSVTFARPLPIAPETIRGRHIRIFVWLKGDDVGARNNCWHAPSMWVTMKDAAGNVLSSADSYFKTLRTYPWHCYYTDRFVPRDAAGVYIRLFNKFHGVAHFSTLSWEPIDEPNTYTDDEKQDPHTGSLACNPLYDEMPEHLKKGFGYRHKWTFVRGSAAGLIGQPYDITTREGFRRYYFEEAKTEPEHMNHAILYMQSMYRNGLDKGMLPPMEEGWLESFAQILCEDQDPTTGYWHDGVALSLGLTFHLVNMHFRYYEIARTDREDRVRPSFDLGLKTVPRAEAIIRTSLMMQSSTVDGAGVRRRAAWNTAAYRYTEEPDGFPDKCYLATTWDAIQLMRLARRYVEAPLQEQVDASVKAAFRYVLDRCVLDSGVFLQRDTDEHPTSGDYMHGIMQDTAWLERKIRADMPGPEVGVVAAEGGSLTLTWANPAPEHNSVRVYVAPADLRAPQLSEAHLAGIIHRTGHRPLEMDPLQAVRHIRQAMHHRWGTPLELPSEETWQGKHYLPWKLRRVSYPIPRADDLQPLTLVVAEGTRVFVSACDWYGEESAPVPAEPVVGQPSL